MDQIDISIEGQTVVSAKTRMPSERNIEVNALSQVSATVTTICNGRDADDNMRDLVQRDRLSNDVRVGVENVLPEFVSHDNAWLRRGRVRLCISPGGIESRT